MVNKEFYYGWSTFLGYMKRVFRCFAAKIIDFLEPSKKRGLYGRDINYHACA